MLIQMGPATVNVVEALKLRSAVANAVRVTVLPTIVGNVEDCTGTVNVMGTPGPE
jgi:hypothetical protein